MKPARFNWLAVGFGLLILLIIALADFGYMPGFISALYAFPNGDKAGHFILMGTLSLLVNLAAGSRNPGDLVRRIIFATGTLMFVVALEEASQALFASRHADWSDLAASYAGILTGGAIVVGLGLRKMRSFRTN